MLVCKIYLHNVLKNFQSLKEIGKVFMKLNHKPLFEVTIIKIAQNLYTIEYALYFNLLIIGHYKAHNFILRKALIAVNFALLIASHEIRPLYLFILFLFRPH